MDIENVKMTTTKTSSMRLRACFASMIRLMLFLALLPATGWAGNLPSTALGGESAPFEQGIQEIRYPEEPAAVVAQRHQALLDKARTEGAVSVIVRLRLTLLPEAHLEFSGIQQQRDRLSDVQQRVLNQLSATHARSHAQLGVKRFVLTPGFAIRADEQMLWELQANPEVLDIVEDGLNTPTLSQSVPLIGGGPLGDFAGLTGQGWTVAVLDTGVEKNHPFLSGKVVSEACYSEADPDYGRSSLCPGGVASSTESDSGLPCTAEIGGCAHGTHVAGIVAGSGSEFSGVAKDAEIIAIQVFHRQDLPINCNPSPAPCVSATDSDIILGLERVFALRESHSIAAANMSLGSGRFYSHCDFATRKPVIDQLRTAGIATVIASGNDWFTDSISSPACISTAVSVGSTTKADGVSIFSNSASFLDLLAPGTDIDSSVLNGQYASNSGTSMAAPHVAGAWAVLKEAKPNASVDEILNALVSTGIAVTDTREGAQQRVKPRIQVDQAVDTLFTQPLAYTLNVYAANPETAIDGVVIGSDPMAYGGMTPYRQSDITPEAAITLTAPATVSNAHGTVQFINWAGCDSMVERDCTVMMTQNRAVTANYTAPYLTLLTNGVPVTGVSGAPNSKRYFYIEVPEGATLLEIVLTYPQPGLSDPTLYMRRGQVPTTSEYDCLGSAYLDAGYQICGELDPDAGTYYVLLDDGYAGYTGVTLTATYTSTALYTLNVNALGAAGVAMTANPSIYAGTTNYSYYPISAGTSLTLTAPATVGDTIFSHWSGCGSTSGYHCTVSMTRNRTVTANYSDDDCVDHVQLDNITVNNDRRFSACRTLTATTFVAESPANVVFRAGERITLGTGFRVYPGARFIARIEPALQSAMRQAPRR